MGIFPKLHSTADLAATKTKKYLTDLIFDQSEEELKGNPDSKNIIRFFGSEEAATDKLCFVVDLGLGGCKQQYATLVAPKGKHKYKVDKQNTIVKHHTPDQKTEQSLAGADHAWAQKTC